MMNRRALLIIGDTLTIAILTVIGFASHGELTPAFIPRMGTTFLPVLISWFLLAPWFGLYDEALAANAKLLWRVPFAMLLAAPLATVLRATLLADAVSPLFTIVLGSAFALGMLLWRTALGFGFRRRSI